MNHEQQSFAPFFFLSVIAHNNDNVGGNNALQDETARDTNISVEDGFQVIIAREENYQTRNDTSDLAMLTKPPVSLKAQTYTTRTSLNMGIPCDQ